MKKNIKTKMNFKKIFMFALPSITMMIFMSSYTIIDGIFVSEYVGYNALSAVNIVFPLISFIYAIGIMFAAGGSALVSKYLGENNLKNAKEAFTLITLFSVTLVIIISAIFIAFLDHIIILLGADEETFNYAKTYIIPILILAPTAVLQANYQNFFVVASKPKLGLFFTILSGLANILLDYIFMKHLNMGIVGAAYATVIGYSITAIGGSLFFFLNKHLHFTKITWHSKWILNSMSNGSSEMVTNLSTALTTLLFNIVMMHLIGSKGVASITAILYSQFIMNSFFMGYSIGIAPILSYHYGAKNLKYVRKIRNESFIFISLVSLGIFMISIASANIIAEGFSSNDEEIKNLITRGIYLFSISYLFSGLNIFNSALFTALSDGKTSALISFLRTFIYIIFSMLIMVLILKTDGVFLAIPVAEILTILTTLIFFKKQYSKVEIKVIQSL